MSPSPRRGRNRWRHEPSASARGDGCAHLGDRGRGKGIEAFHQRLYVRTCGQPDIQLQLFHFFQKGGIAHQLIETRAQGRSAFRWRLGRQEKWTQSAITYPRAKLDYKDFTSRL